jgi:imidazolonepropionase-like amidohydrolase
MRKSITNALVALSLIPLTGLTSDARTTAYVGATLFDGTGADPFANAVVLVEGERIVGVGSRADVVLPEGANIVDVTGKWIVPGLVDAHIHFFQSAGLYTRPDIVDRRTQRSYSEEMALINERLDETFRRHLASGTTAVVDVGGPYWNFEVREKASNMTLAPRTAVAGPLISTVSRPQMDIGDPPIVKANSAAAARAMVQDQLKHAPDLVKIWYIVSSDGDYTDNLELVRATIDEAHGEGVRVAVHATSLEAARASVEAGADILVHSVSDQLVDKGFVELVRQRGAIYTTTLIVREGYAEVLGGNVDLLDVEKRLGDPDVVKTWSELYGPADDEALRESGARRTERLAHQMPIMQANLKAMHDGGAIVAAGTDAGNIGTLHGPSIHRELRLMVEAGLSPREALIAATRNAARVFASEPEFGTLESGKLADMLILNANPLEDIVNLEYIDRVVKGGEVLDPRELLPPTPETVVQRQVEAYNARDIEAFLSFYAEDVRIARLPLDEVSYDGREAMRARYSRLFENNPELNCTIVNRTVHGNWIVDQEFVSGVENRPRIRAVAIYEVRDGLIQNVWFLPGDN